MKQILQSLKRGATEVTEVPCPGGRRGRVLIRTTRSLVSAGTERMLVEFGKANLIEKARQQPDKVRAVLDKIGTDGVMPTMEAVFSKLDSPLPLGYCNVGIVDDVGEGVTGFSVGDRVVSNGAHAELVSVPSTLCAKIPTQVDDDAAVFAVLGAVGLQGIRLAQPTLGETVVVSGLGLIGLLTVQLLRAQGCRVLGIDFDSRKLALAAEFGAEVVDLSKGADPVAAAQLFSRGRGVDAVLITASTQSSEPIHQAAHMCRKRGRIVQIGVTGLELSRADFYEKELSFQVSCSYGPGRYDTRYEDQAQDYPFGYVRWTAQRNFEAVLDMIAAGKLDVTPLITHRFALDAASDAYDLVTSKEREYLGVLIDYPVSERVDRNSTISVPRSVSAEVKKTPTDVVVGVIGAGNYSGRTLMPALAKTNATLQVVASAGGLSATHFAKKYRFAEATTDLERLWSDECINTIVIATRHDSHAQLVCKALEAGKNVFVEKPLALNNEQLEQIEAVYENRGGYLCVGFNRRFAPLVRRTVEHINTRSGPLVVNITVNAGELPESHWTRDPAIGGGRILGEACHFIDLARFLVGNPIESLEVTTASSASTRHEDISMLQLGFEDGSVASIHYLSNGHRRFPKERVELFWDSKVICIDNFRKLRGWGVSSSPTWGFTRQNKGHALLMSTFAAAIRDGAPAPIPMSELFEVSRWSIEAGLRARSSKQSVRS